MAYYFVHQGYVMNHLYRKKMECSEKLKIKQVKEIIFTECGSYKCKVSWPHPLN